MQNKISTLENQNGLWKVFGDENIAFSITMLLNTMFELSSLATKFKLKEELNYGGCFEKILSLLGNSRERNFISKCKNATKPEEWERLVEFLKKEFDVRERLTQLYKSKKCLGIHLKDSKDHKKSNNGSRSVKSVNSNKTKCHICDKLDHAVVTNCKGEDVPYFACKKFVEMTNEDRRKILFEKDYVGRLSGLWPVGYSEPWSVGLSGPWPVGLSGPWPMGLFLWASRGLGLWASRGLGLSASRVLGLSASRGLGLLASRALACWPLRALACVGLSGPWACGPLGALVRDLRG